MNICFVTTEFISEQTDFDGGLANYLYKISTALLKEGHKVLVIVQSFENKRFDYKGITVERVKVDFNNPIYKIIKFILRRGEDLDWVFGSYILNKRLKEVLNKEHFDILQYSSFRATALFRPKHVTTIVRLSSFHPFWKNLDGISKISKEDRKMVWLGQEAVKRADGVFSPSNVVAIAMSKATGRKIEVIETLYTIPQISDWSLPNNYKNLANKNYLLFIGKINGVKGGVVIAQAIYRILDKYKDIHFVFAGRDAGCKQMIIDSAKEYSERLIFLDRVEKEDLFKIIKYSHAAVLPSLMDNFPNACIEVMSVKKLVIGTDGASFEQLITDGQNGFLINKGDSDSLFRKVIELMELTNEQKQEMEQKSFERILLLNPAVVVKKTIEFYNTVNSYKDHDTNTNTTDQN